MRITYFLPDTSLFGGNKIVLHQANLMARRGHQVTVAATGGKPDWFDVEAAFVSLPQFDSPLPPADVTVATYWKTIEPAIAAGQGQVIHYCQGYEGIYTHNAAEHHAIRRAYSNPIPAMVLSPHLGELVRREFHRPWRHVPPPIERHWKPRLWRLRPAKPARILITSPFEIDWKGVETSLHAVLRMREQGLACRLIRISQWPLSPAEEAIVRPDEFHLKLRPPEVSEVVRGSDLFFAASWEQEGFGMPVLEALRCGVPVVASDISAFRGFASRAARLVPARDPEAFSNAALEILTRPRTWRNMRQAGIRTSEQFREEKVVEAAESTLEWARSQAWRREMEPSPAAGE